jgi:hypothetical protein
MDQSTAFMALKYRLGLGTEAARTLMDRATTETVAALSDDRWLLGFTTKAGQPRFDLVDVTR